MMKLYVQILGPYDVTVVGPFTKADDVEAFKKTVPQQFDWHVMSQFELDENFAKFGALKIETPDTYNF